MQNFFCIAPPDSPKNLSIQFLSQTTAFIEWKPSADNTTIIKYQVDVLPPPAEGLCLSGSCSTVDAEMNITDLLYDCIEYTFNVRAINCAGTSSSSEIIRGYINQYVPKPENVTVNAINNTSAMVSWSVGNNCSLQYEIDYGSDSRYIKTVDGDTSYVITNLTKEMTYNINVVSKFKNRTSERSTPFIIKFDGKFIMYDHIDIILHACSSIECYQVISQAISNQLCIKK